MTEKTRPSVHGSPDRRKTALAAAVGTSVENYDFIAYGTASALYFGEAFFPDNDPTVGTLLSFATLAVGFLMRPLGGAAGGYLGDRFGRKPVLVIAMLVMGAATVLIGALPTYAQAGVLAPILLVLIRMIQGLAFGAACSPRSPRRATHSASPCPAGCSSSARTWTATGSGGCRSSSAPYSSPPACSCARS